MLYEKVYLTPTKKGCGIRHQKASCYAISLVYKFFY